MMTDIAEFPPGVRAFAGIPLEARVWEVLRGNPDQSIRALTRRLGSSKDSITAAINRLVAVGYVRREGHGVGRPVRYYALDPSEQRIA